MRNLLVDLVNMLFLVRFIRVIGRCHASQKEGNMQCIAYVKRIQVLRASQKGYTAEFVSQKLSLVMRGSGRYEVWSRRAI
jgi:hypothetical protein